MTQPKLTPAQECVLRYLNEHVTATPQEIIEHVTRGGMCPVNCCEGVYVDWNGRKFELTPAGIKAARQLQRKDGE